MNANVRNVAWAIAEAWWRKQHRVAAGFVPEAESQPTTPIASGRVGPRRRLQRCRRSSPRRSISAILPSGRGLHLMCCSAPLEASSAS
jgi:hypothetical protein